MDSEGVHPTAYLLLSGERLSLAKDDAERQALIESVPYCRLSPIHKVSPNSQLPASPTYRVHFFELICPYATIGKIVHSFPNISRHAWFSIGLASFILLDPPQDLVESVLDSMADHVLATEVWSIESAVVTNREHRLFRSPPGFSSDLLLESRFSNLDIDAKQLIDELQLSLNSFYSLAMLHTPGRESLAISLVGQINSLAVDLDGNLGILNSSSGTPRELAYVQSRVHRIVDQFVQLNSVLSYVISQSFSGAIPILERCSVIPAHSLLGIGVAVQAIESVLQSADRAFYQIPVVDFVRQNYSTTVGFDPFQSEVSLPLEPVMHFEGAPVKAGLKQMRANASR
jgi:hypothetical protein